MNRLDALCDISVKNFVSMSYRYSTKPTAKERVRTSDLGLIFVAEGHAVITTDDKVISLYEGDGVFVPLNIRYKYSRPHPGKILVLNFTAYDSSMLTDFAKFHVNDPKHVVPYIDSIKSLFFSSTENKRLAMLPIFYNLLLNILHSSTPPQHFTLSKAISYMRENLGNTRLDSQEIAKASGYSEGHLRRLFKELYSVTPIQYLNNLRIEASKNLLLSTNLSVKEISEQCGFNSPFYFSNVFKAKLGCSPAGYREENIISI